MSHTIAENIQRLQTAKTDIKTALQNKGVEVTDRDGFESFASKINSIVSSTLRVFTKADNTITVSQPGLSIPSQTATTDGQCLIFIVSEGEWTITASKPGDTDYSVNVTLERGECRDAYVMTTYIVGVSWTRSSTDPKMRRTDDAAWFPDPIPYKKGRVKPSSPFDTLMPWAGMQPVTINGQEMVKIPKYYVAITAYPLSIRISNKPLTGYTVSMGHRAYTDHPERDFCYISRYVLTTGYNSSPGTVLSTTLANHRTYINNKGSGWFPIDYPMIMTYLYLVLVEYATFCYSPIIGIDTLSATETNDTNKMPYHTGALDTSNTTGDFVNPPTGTNHVRYRYIDHPFVSIAFDGLCGWAVNSSSYTSYSNVYVALYFDPTTYGTNASSGTNCLLFTYVTRYSASGSYNYIVGAPRFLEQISGGDSLSSMYSVLFIPPISAGNWNYYYDYYRGNQLPANQFTGTSVSIGGSGTSPQYQSYALTQSWGEMTGNPGYNLVTFSMGYSTSTPALSTRSMYMP